MFTFSVLQINVRKFEINVLQINVRKIHINVRKFEKTTAPEKVGSIFFQCVRFFIGIKIWLSEHARFPNMLFQFFGRHVEEALKMRENIRAEHRIKINFDKF